MKPFTITSASLTGKVRSNNEDMILVNDEFIRDRAYKTELKNTGPPFLIAVADGMGGHNGGEIASEYVLRNMAHTISLPGNTREEEQDISLTTNFGADALKKILEAKIREVHQSLNSLGEKTPSLKGLGCTFTGLLFFEQRIFMIHIGDSRMYRLRGAFLAPLTNDHTKRNQLNDPDIPANILVNCFGGGVAGIFFDFEELTDRLVPGDKLVLCSDGLYGELTSEEIARGLLNGEIADELVQKANEKGGHDNISCIVIEI